MTRCGGSSQAARRPHARLNKLHLLCMVSSSLEVSQGPRFIVKRPRSRTSSVHPFWRQSSCSLPRLGRAPLIKHSLECQGAFVHGHDVTTVNEESRSSEAALDHGACFVCCQLLLHGLQCGYRGTSLMRNTHPTRVTTGSWA